MKNILKKISLLASLCLFIVACEEDVNPTFTPEGGFVQLATDGVGVTANTTLLENAPSPSITTIILDSPKSNDVVIELNVTSSDNSRFDIVSGTSLTIPAGEVSANLVIQPIDNFLTDGDVEILVELSQNNSLDLGVAGDGNFSVSRTISLLDDDCPISINDWVGTYTVFENFTGGVNAPSGLNNFFSEIYQIELSLDPTDVTGTKVIINNSPGFNEYIADGTVMSFLTCSSEVAFDAGFPTVALFRVFEFEATSYNESDFVIQATGPLSTFGPYQFTFTKQ